MDSILVADTFKNEIVISTTCAETKFEDVDNFQVDVRSLPVLRDSHDVIKYVDASIDIAKGCLQIGSFIFPEAAPVLLFLSGAGTAVQYLLGKLPDDRPDPVVVRLKELEQTVHEVEKKMKDKFNDMKEFITEFEFSDNIITEASVLMKLMRDCLVHHNEETMETFRAAYAKHPPLSLAYVMMSYLEQKTTNPLVMAMEQKNSLDTFEKWEVIIKGILGKLLVIEGFASGLFKDKNTFDGERLLERSKEVVETLNFWREEYGYSKYWLEMKAFLEDYIPKSTNLNNYQKAEQIKAKLESFETSDSFYLCVFDQCKKDTDYTYHCPKESTQLIGIWDKGLCNTIVYRSRKANEFPNAIFENSEKTMKMCHENYIYYKGTIEHTINDDFINRGLVRGDGLIFIASDSYHPEIRYTDCSKHTRAPGSYDKMTLINKNDNDKRTNWEVIVAFP